MNGDLSAALVAAFPPIPITHAVIHAGDARWTDYDARERLPELEAASWRELDAPTLERHAGVLVHAGNELYRAILPAYLQLVANGDYASMLPFLVIGQVTRDGNSAFNSERFATRIAPLSTEQRAAVRSALTAIATQPLLHDAATTAIGSW
jgi:hypothetical protein